MDKRTGSTRKLDVRPPPPLSDKKKADKKKIGRLARSNSNKTLENFHVADYKNVLKNFDDGKGRISRIMFPEAMKGMGIHLTPSETQGVFDEFDKDAKGVCKISELVSFAEGDSVGKAVKKLREEIHRLLNIELWRDEMNNQGFVAENTLKTRPTWSPGFDRVFHKFDVDDSGSLSRVEFRAALEDLGVRLTTTELSGVIEAFDEDGDGEVSVEEFVKFIKRDGRVKKIKEKNDRLNGEGEEDGDDDSDDSDDEHDESTDEDDYEDESESESGSDSASVSSAASSIPSEYDRLGPAALPPPGKVKEAELHMAALHANPLVKAHVEDHNVGHNHAHPAGSHAARGSVSRAHRRSRGSRASRGSRESRSQSNHPDKMQVAGDIHSHLHRHTSMLRQTAYGRRGKDESKDYLDAPPPDSALRGTDDTAVKNRYNGLQRTSYKKIDAAKQERILSKSIEGGSSYHRTTNTGLSDVERAAAQIRSGAMVDPSLRKRRNCVFISASSHDGDGTAVGGNKEDNDLPGGTRVYRALLCKVLVPCLVPRFSLPVIDTDHDFLMPYRSWNSRRSLA